MRRGASFTPGVVPLQVWKTMTIELRISGETVSVSAVAEVLAQLEVAASVVATVNVRRESAGARCEPGAIVLLTDCDRTTFADSVWPELKAAFGLRCGWMDATERGFRGCTENFCRSTSCPEAPSPRDVASN